MVKDYKLTQIAVRKTKKNKADKQFLFKCQYEHFQIKKVALKSILVKK
jgi:hypothetical protein